MTFRDRMNVKVSGMEEDILVELQRRHLTKLLHTQRPFTFDREKEGVAGTWIDFFYESPFLIAVFIDFIKHHTTLNQERKDELIDRALERRGVDVYRFSYTGRTKKRMREIVDSIEGILRQSNYTFRVVSEML